jgi:sugar O-acyltransferase (sialic acid O-acetyltransferase NeuD family)
VVNFKKGGHFFFNFCHNGEISWELKMHIIGAGGHAKVIVDIINLIPLQIEGVWVENNTDKLFLSYSLGDLKSFKLKKNGEFIIAIGNNYARKRIANDLEHTNVIAIHPSSSAANSATIGVGSVLMANASLNAHATIGEHVIINTNASVDHDCKIANFVHISPQVGLAGNVEVGEGTHIGIGACVIQDIKIGKWATIGAGAVIIKDVPDYAVVVGNPGKVIKYNLI